MAFGIGQKMANDPNFGNTFFVDSTGISSLSPGCLRVALLGIPDLIPTHAP
jgi:hypothetical protein